MERPVVERLEKGNTLERYVAILDVFAGLRPAGGGRQNGTVAFGVSDISRTLGLPKGTVSRYLHRLEDVGLLSQLPDRRYNLTTRVYHWGQAATPAADIRALARPMMERLASGFGEPVSLFVLEPNAAVCIDQVDGVHPVRLNAAVGRRLPLHTGSSPRLLLAHASQTHQDAVLAQAPFTALTPQTITDAVALRRALAEARRHGYVVSQGESNEGVVGIAAPIRDQTGLVHAALSIAGPADRLNGVRLDAAITGLTQATEAISKSLGFTPTTTEGRT